MNDKGRIHDPYAALKYREYRFYTGARLSLTMALQMQAVIIGWLIYAHTKDPLSLGLIGLTEAIPSIGISLFGGHLADRADRRKIILSFILLLMVASLSLFVFSINEASNFIRFGTFPVYAVIFIIGVARGFLAPAITAFGAQLVPKEIYPNASAWNSSVWQLGAVTGPAIGGLAYGMAGGSFSTAMVCLLILISIGCYLVIGSKKLPGTPNNENLRESLASGIRFVFASQVFISAITLDLFAVLFGGAVALLPVFADQVLKVGPTGLGFLRAAPAFGAVIMAIILAYRPPTRNAGIKLLWSVAGFGLCMILFAISTNFYFSLFILAISGMLDNVSVVIRSTIMQLMTPEEMRGRVSAVNSIFIGSSNEIGAFESGFAARLLTLVPSVIFGGSMTLLITAVTARFAPNLRKLNL
jgi:MFS family permease